MELGHRVWLRTTFGSCRTCRDPNAAHALPRPPQGLSLATRVLNQDGHTIARASRAVTDSGHWRTWGVAIPALGISRHLIPRGLARPAVATQEDPGKRQQLGFWPALLAYVILTQVHQRSLRGLVASGLAPPSLAVVIGLHTLAFLIAALFVGLGQRGSAARRTLVVPLAVLITEVFSWEALGRLRGNDHLALSVALLSGLMLPLCMAASRPFLGRRFSFGAWVGAFMVAAGVGLCHLGHPLMSVGSTAEAVLLGAACFLPCLSLVGKEALLTGNQRFSIPAVGLLICIAQLLAVVLPRYRPPTSAALYTELATLRFREWTSSSVSFGADPGLLSIHAPARQRDGSAGRRCDRYFRPPAKRGSLVARLGRSCSLSAWTRARAGSQIRGAGSCEKGWETHEFLGRTQTRKERSGEDERHRSRNVAPGEGAGLDESTGGKSASLGCAAETEKTVRTPSALAGTLVTARGEAARGQRSAAAS